MGEPGSIHEPARLLDHGRVDARKGVLDLLAAVRLLLDTGRRVRLAVSGIGPDSARLAEQVRADGLAGHVDLLGYIPYQDAHRVYGYGDVFVSPTYAEGFSNTILEAMASGLPVVSTDVVGVRDCIRDGENGVLVPAADPVALAGAVGALLDDAPRRRRLAGVALAEVRKRWSWPVIADQITNVYDRVLHHRAPIPTLPAPPVDLGCRFRSAPHLL